MNIWSYHLTSVDYLNDLRPIEAFEDGLITGWWATIGEAFFAMLADRKETLEDDLKEADEDLREEIKQDIADWLNPELWDINEDGEQIFFMGDEDTYARTVN